MKVPSVSPEPSWLMCLVVGLAVAVTAFSAAYDYGTTDAVGTLIVLAACVMLMTAILIMSVMSISVGVLGMLYGVYHVFLYYIPGMLHVSRNQFPFYGWSYNVALVDDGITVVLTYSVMSFIGYFLAAHLRPSLATAADSDRAHPTKGKGFGVTAAVLLGLSVCLVLIVGPGVFVTRRDATVSTSVGDGAIILVSLANMAAIIGLALTVYLLRQRVTIAGVGACLIATGINLVVNFPLRVSRFYFFGFLIIIIFQLFDLRNRIYKVSAVFVFLACLGTVFPALSHFQRGDNHVGFEIDPIDYYMTSGDLDGLQSTLNVVDLVDATGPRYGWQALSALLFFVPRSIWPDKGQPTGVIAADYVGYQFLNISAPFPSELYVDFGYLGVVVGGFLVGFAVRRLDVAAANTLAGSNPNLRILHAGFAGFCIIFLRGSILGIIAPLTLYFVLSGGVGWMLARLRQAPKRR